MGSRAPARGFKFISSLKLYLRVRLPGSATLVQQLLPAKVALTSAQGHTGSPVLGATQRWQLSELLLLKNINVHMYIMY